MLTRTSHRWAASSATLLLSAFVHAQAQETATRLLQGHFSAGYSGTTGVTSDYLKGGWIIDTGLTWTPRPDQPYSLRSDLYYRCAKVRA